MILMKYALNKKKTILGLRILETVEDSTHQFFPPQKKLRGNFFKVQHIYANTKLPNVYSG